MAGSSAPPPPARVPRVSVLGGDGAVYDVFEVVAWDDQTLVVRAPLLFEVGEELRLRIERDGGVTQAVARVEGHDRQDGDVRTAMRLRR